MIFPEIKKLYKYTPFNEYTLSILINEQFWFSKPENFNDPLDCGIKLTNQTTPDVMLQRLKGDLATMRAVYKATTDLEEKARLSIQFKNYDKIIKAINSGDSGNWISTETPEFLDEIEKHHFEIRKSGILSLSELNDNMLMWSHYSAQHKGICIELARTNNNDLANNNITLPVRYSIKKPYIGLQEAQLADPTEKREITRSLIYTKSTDWAYEREWRSIRPEGNRAYEVNAKILSVIFGVKTEESTKKTVAELVSRLKSGIKLKQAKLKKDDFGIEIENYRP